MDAESKNAVPACPGDGEAMIATIAGWRCPICGVAALRARRTDDPAKAAHPAFR